MEHLKVKKWDAVIEDGRITMYAVTADGRKPVPRAFQSMCDDRHMAIAQVSCERPELFDCSEGVYWVPLRT